MNSDEEASSQRSDDNSIPKSFTTIFLDLIGCMKYANDYSLKQQSLIFFDEEIIKSLFNAYKIRFSEDFGEQVIEIYGILVLPDILNINSVEIIIYLQRNLYPRSIPAVLINNSYLASNQNLRVQSNFYNEDTSYINKNFWDEWRDTSTFHSMLISIQQYVLYYILVFFQYIEYTSLSSTLNNSYPPLFKSSYVSSSLFTDIIPINNLNKGTGCRVYKCIYKEKTVCLKCLENPSSPLSIVHFLREIYYQEQIHHKYIIQIYGVSIYKNHLCILMEYAHQGTLRDLLRGNPKYKYKSYNNVPMKTRRQICIQILKGYQIFSTLNICHRDIKPDNFVIDNNIIKYCDMGFSKEMKDDLCNHTLCGTIEYCAPEILECQEYNNSVDIYSISLTLYEVITGHYLFEDLRKSMNRNEFRKRIVSFTTDIYLSYQLPNILRDMFQICILNRDRKRLSINELLGIISKWNPNEKVSIL